MICRPRNFMVLTRATNQPGPDGVLGTADDIHEHTNTTSPFVDQNQTYSSHPSHQVFLRAYELNAAGDPVATGKLIVNRDLGADGSLRHRRRRRDRRHGHLGRRQGAGARHPRHRPHRCRRHQRAAAGDRRLRQLPARPERLPAGGDDGARRPARNGRRRAGRGQPGCAASASPTPCAPATPSSTTSPTPPRRATPDRRAPDGRRRRRRRRPRRSRRRTTTNCSTPTTSPATAASTRTSA